jgi:cytochrome P450
LLAYLSSLPDENERTEVLKLIQSYVIDPDSNAAASFDVASLLRDQTLNSALSETLRLQMDGLAPRKAERETVLKIHDKDYVIHKGEFVLLVFACVHKNPKLYKNPREFQLKRMLFLHEKPPPGKEYSSQTLRTDDGKNIRNPFVWWGGGKHIVCLNDRLHLMS